MEAGAAINYIRVSLYIKAVNYQNISTPEYAPSKYSQTSQSYLINKTIRGLQNTPMGERILVNESL